MKKVIIYTTSSCHWCQLTKEYLNKKGIPFEEKNIEVNPELGEELVEKTGQMGVPVIEIDGKIILGYSPLEIDEALRE